MFAHDDVTTLPANLPAPSDDGATAHLLGLSLPALSFPSTGRSDVLLADLARGLLVLYIYPRTARPGEPLPEGWNETPGARGCTAESCAFRDRHSEFARFRATVAGLSGQTPAYQREAATRLDLPFLLLADPELRLAKALGLPTFSIAGRTLYRRVTLIACRNEIVKVFYPVFPPDENASEALAWLDENLSSFAGRRAG